MPKKKLRVPKPKPLWRKLRIRNSNFPTAPSSLQFPTQCCPDFWQGLSVARHHRNPYEACQVSCLTKMTACPRWIHHCRQSMVRRKPELQSNQRQTGFGWTRTTFQLTSKGTPFIYQGDELGMTNYPFASI